jgi:hypothetical protein
MKMPQADGLRNALFDVFRIQSSSSGSHLRRSGALPVEKKMTFQSDTYTADIEITTRGIDSVPAGEPVWTHPDSGTFRDAMRVHDEEFLRQILACDTTILLRIDNAPGFCLI